MIGLDTNVLVRYLTRDDAAQSAAARHLVEDARAKGVGLFINRVVLSELVWVLSKPYRLRRSEIADAVECILITTQFEIEDKDAVWGALREYRSTSVDFADCLKATSNEAAGCGTTATFDREAGKLDAFSLLAPQDSGATPPAA